LAKASYHRLLRESFPQKAIEDDVNANTFSDAAQRYHL